jgi:hypothetical protein
MGTPKRISSTADIQRSIITPNELNMHQRKHSQGVTNLTKKSSMSLDESSDTQKKIVSKDVTVGEDVVVESKNMIFGNKDQAEVRLEKKLSETAKPGQTISSSNSLFAPKKLTDDMTNKDSDKSENTEPAKPEKASMSIFGQGKQTIDMIKASRSANNNSPSFGESNNQDKESENSKPDNKISLFKTKSDAIPEAKNEDEGESESKDDKTPKDANLFISPNKDRKPKITPKEDTGSIFLKKVSDAKKPINLFGGPSTEKPAEKPKVSLFGSADSSEPKKRIFGTPKAGPSIFGTQNDAVASTPRVGAKATTVDDDDVGMGGVTPPKRSPNVTPVQSSNPGYTFKRTESTTGMHSQGSGESKPSGSIFGGSTQSPFGSGPAKTSIFGSQSSTSAANASNTGAAQKSLFTMGSNPKSSGKVSLFGNVSGGKPASLFASAPSQGQPEVNKPNSWNEKPFGSKPKQKKDDDDGLFSGFK